jgi:GAF domain-containing protein
MIRRFFGPPQFENDDDNFRARFINIFAWTVISVLSFALIWYISNPADDLSVYMISGLIVVLLTAIYLLRMGKIKMSGLIITSLGWLGIGLQAYTADGVKDIILVAYIALSLFASVIIDWRAGGIVMAASLATIWALALLEANGYFTPRFQDPLIYARDLSLVFFLTAVLIYFHAKSLRDAILRANQSEEGLNTSNQSLKELNLNLENRVASRTAELELANLRNEKRAKQFEAIAQVARATATNESLETLLPRLTTLISEQFGFYHTGIFLLDEKREYAVLRAANSEGGNRMLARGHKLKVGQTGMVGFVTAVGTPRIALDVGSDAVYFDNPDLPNTRSEMAIPLRIAGEIIGALDVQSIVSNAFQEDDIELLSTLADQVSIAIQNIRSYETMQGLLMQAQKVAGAYIQDAWRALQSEETGIGYRAAGGEVNPLTRPLTSANVKKAVKEGQTVVESGKTAALAIPIRLRDEVIGVLDIRTHDEHDWDEDEVDITEAVADRLSLAIETSLLLMSTQRRAEIERITADISGKIGATTQFDSILRTAAEELSRALGGSEVLVQIQPQATPGGDGN